MIQRQEPPASASYLFNADMAPYRELFLRRCPPPLSSADADAPGKSGMQKGRDKGVDVLPVAGAFESLLQQFLWV